MAGARAGGVAGHMADADAIRHGSWSSWSRARGKGEGERGGSLGWVEGRVEMRNYGSKDGRGLWASTTSN